MSKKSLKERIYEKHPGLYLLMVVTRHVLKGDKEYINKVFNIDSNPDYIKLQRKGTNNFGKTIFVIEDLDRSVGFCAVIVNTINKLMYAEEHGLTPYIKYSENFLYFDKAMEANNPFEYYFEPVGKAGDESSVSTVYAEDCHANYSKGKYHIDAWDKANYYDKSLMTSSGTVIEKYLKIKPELIKECSELLGKEKNPRILGVHYRGTDYKVGYNMHPVQAKRAQFTELIEKSLNEYDKIFLATDDKEMHSYMKEKYADKILSYEDVERSEGDVSVAFLESSREKHHYKLGYEVLRDVYTLSLCDGLIAGKSHVSFLADLYKMSRKDFFEQLEIIDNGSNSNDNNFYDSVMNK